MQQPKVLLAMIRLSCAAISAALRKPLLASKPWSNPPPKSLTTSDSERTTSIGATAI